MFTRDKQNKKMKKMKLTKKKILNILKKNYELYININK